jgi:peptidoglycan/xylan/chitin deacetylase (PgdA/CDA1 family)
MRRVSNFCRSVVNLCALFALGVALAGSDAANAQVCAKPVYLTLDTGHMGVAALMADVLKRNDVQVTFFAANERTREGGSSLGPEWAAWWKARELEGHEFASHTYDHVYWRGDMAGGDGRFSGRFRVRPSSGPREGQDLVWDGRQYCAEISRAADRLAEITGKKALPLFRAPGGKTSAQLLRMARSCGYAHVGWSAAGFLGDELSSEQFSNEALLQKALREIKPGDVLMAHLGIWSRKDPWAPAVFEPLIVGLKAKGFCFLTLRAHPGYRDFVAQSGR